MVKILDNCNLELKIEECKKIDLKLIDNGNYLLIDLKDSRIKINRKNKLGCDACGGLQLGGEGFYNYKGILFCKECLEQIKKGKIGTVTY